MLLGDSTNSPQNGTLSIGPNPTKVQNLMIGSIEGGGQISMGTFLGQSSNATIGSNNLSTTFDGVILGDAGVSVTKIGTGTLTLTNGANTTRVERTSVTAPWWLTTRRDLEPAVLSR